MQRGARNVSAHTPEDSATPPPRTVRTIELRGPCTLGQAMALWNRVRSEGEALEAGTELRLDLSAAEPIDAAAMVVLEHARRALDAKGVTLSLGTLPGHLKELAQVYAGTTEAEGAAPAAIRTDVLSRTGRRAELLAREAVDWLRFTGRLLRSLAAAARQPRRVAWHEIFPLLEQAGADAIASVAITAFLVGIVTAYDAALQLRRFGATLYIADLVGASIVHELGPLITAVVVTGRTGAAFAAELGTMRVSEEIDALRTLGFDPLCFLVLPRVLALVVAVPVLTLVGDFVGLMGGMLLAHAAVGMTGPEYFAETRTIVFGSDIFWGVLKGAVFALAIALIACQQGLKAAGGPSGVGQRTTSSVVASLFAIIVIDAMFAPLFRGHYP